MRLELCPEKGGEGKGAGLRRGEVRHSCASPEDSWRAVARDRELVAIAIGDTVLLVTQEHSRGSRESIRLALFTEGAHA